MVKIILLLAAALAVGIIIALRRNRKLDKKDQD
jgi:ABC-type dipeptide/oligopeptide/nickel transport system permease component